MPRLNSKHAILNAAEAIVLESGAAHMTLDAVAERSRISKGGLIYNFPTKEALLEAMIGRLMDRLEALREQVRRDFAPENPNELTIEIRMLSGMSEVDARLSAALLAVIANQPDLMNPFRQKICERFSKRILVKGCPEHSTILFFAAFGLHFAELLKIPFLDADQRRKMYADLLRLAGSDGEIRPETVV